ncbi:hypothetical protein ElyMa_001283800, partial [Elysia marginata]
MQGKGRRPGLPTLSLTHNLLLKLYFLMLEGGQSYKELKSWLVKLIPNTECVTESRIIHQVNSILKRCSSCTVEEAEQFLAEEYDFHSLQPPLSTLGLNRLHLLGTQPYEHQKLSNTTLTNEVVVALEHFRSKEALQPIFVRKWIETLRSSPNPTLTDKQLRSKVEKAIQQYKKLLRSKSKNPEMLKDFLQCPFFMSTSDTVSDSLKSSNNANVSNQENTPCAECISLKENLAEKEICIKDLKNENKTFCRINEDLNEEMHAKEELIIDLNLDRQKKEALELEVKELKQRLKQSQKDRNLLLDELEEMKKTKLYKKNQSVKKKLLEVSEKNDQLLKQAESGQENHEMLSKKINSLKRKVKSEQSIKSKYKKKFQEQRTINSDLNSMLETDDVTLRTSGSSHRYNDNVRQTYYALQGEANVAATNCSKVIEIVANHLFNTEFNESLPSASTALNFSNEANIIAKQQVATEILANNHFTFACDATSRQKAHYLEQHIVLSNGKTLSLGFSEIASDDSETLLE